MISRVNRWTLALFASFLLGGCNLDSSVIGPADSRNTTDNLLPTANAGADVTVTDADRNGTEAVLLDGSASMDPDGTIATHIWTEGPRFLAAGPTPEVTLTDGTHTLTLSVTDNRGAPATDEVVVTVVSGTGNGNQPPRANAGSDQTATDSDGNGSEAVSLNGSGSSDPDGTISTWVWTEGSSQVATGSRPTVTLAVGSHRITLTVTDNDGDTATDAVTVTVKEPGNISYARDIQPYFDTRCVSCHRNGGDGGADLDSWQHVMDGGRSGAMVVPGDSSKGTLLRKISGGHKGAPHGTTIEQDLAAWIDTGAADN